MLTHCLGCSVPGRDVIEPREGATLDEAGPINAQTLPNPGTQFRVPSFDCDATPYSAAKLAVRSSSAAFPQCPAAAVLAA